MQELETSSAASLLKHQVHTMLPNNRVECARIARPTHKRGINPNEFIVAHPAEVKLIAASPGG